MSISESVVPLSPPSERGPASGSPRVVMYRADGSEVASVASDPQICDDELAREFTSRSVSPGGVRVMFCAQQNRWYHWTGVVWQEDRTLLLFDRIRAFITAHVIGLADQAEAGSVQRTALKDMRAARSARTVAAVERLLRADREHAVAAEELDAHLMLLNTPRGVVDLETGVLMPARPDDLFTKVTGSAPGGSCPTWLAFLDTVTGGDNELAAFLQRVAGYCLTGSTRENALFFLYGTGANGKSTALNVLLHVLGDFGQMAPAETFLETHGERHPTELAMLQGARLVVASEIDEGRQWALARIKAFTGGEPIAARKMRADFFTFRPQFKLMFAGNHRPGLRNVDEAIRRRLYLIPFGVVIPPEERNPDLFEDLKNEADGILAWMIEGCLAWRHQGLDPPRIVREATASYLEAENAFGAWLDERTQRDEQADTGSAELYHDYAKWAERGGEHPVSHRRFTRALEDCGLLRVRDRRGARFLGLRLRDAGEGGGL